MPRVVHFDMNAEDPERGINGGLSKRDGAAPETTNTIEVMDLGVGWFALCEDTERNKFGLLQSDPSAK